EYAGKLHLARKPLLCTFAKVGGKMLLDPMLSEEKAMEARFSCAVTEDDYMSAFQKGGRGGLTLNEINESIEIAFKRAKEVRKLL
ncbi:MAG: RNA-binding protein, partial [Candidatus Diapherotrites archaeon]|nr:RNA-binding protein [Candidatus Diapherotrites archaeon]